MKICVVTATRAEYGLLKPLIQKIDDDPDLELELIVTGTHLVEKHGYTIREIENEDFDIAYRVPILENGNTPYDVSVTMSNALSRFAEVFRDDRPDMLVILGDRTEMLGVASAAMNERIPIAHIHGGEVTTGVVDDCIRHALSKMSYLHFTSTEVYRNRVIQLGENPNRVFNVGALSVENILTEKLFVEEDIRRDMGVPVNMPYVVMTYHPVTLEDNCAKNQINELTSAMNMNNDLYYVITAANADAGGEKVNCLLKKYANTHNNACYVTSLGVIRYLSALRYSLFVLGNSSSGIIEAPVLGTPTVNIGDRQKGRLLADTIVNCKPTKSEIIKSIEIAKSMKHIPTSMYGEGKTSRQIVNIIKDFLFNNKISLKKEFCDL